MFNFIVRRLATSALVVLISTFLMYHLVNFAIDPLSDLRTSTAPNKAFLIERRIAVLDLNTPVTVRYFKWLGNAAGCFVGNCDLGTSWRTGQQVTSQLAGAISTTLQLVTAATILAILLGITIGIVSALRQYTGFDYVITFLSFLFFSLPVFWVAVLAKQYLAIGINDFLGDPVFSWPLMIIVTLVLALALMAGIGGTARRRIEVFVITAVVVLGTMIYMNQTGWLKDPGLGIVVIALGSAGAAVLVTVLSTGLRNRRALYTALTTAGIGVVLYIPLTYLFVSINENWLIIAGLLLVGIVVGIIVGYLYGGPDRPQSMRTGALAAIPVGVLIFVDRMMDAWVPYTQNTLIKGRPIATIGPSTPGLQGPFFVQTLDTFTHLLLPTITLVLISFAGYTRYSRASMLEVLNQDYIRTARAKGLTERTVIMRHAFRNSLIPLASIIPVDIITLVGGAVLTETIFGWSGMGRLFIRSLGGDEIDPVMAYLAIVGILAVVANLVADLLYAVLDPRIRVDA